MVTHVHERARPRTCPYCHDELGGETWTCPACYTAQHLECAREGKRCTSLGCGRPVSATRSGAWTPLAILLVGLVAVLVVGNTLIALDTPDGIALTICGSILVLAVVRAFGVSAPGTPRREVREGPTALPVVEASPPPLPLPVASASPRTVEGEATSPETEQATGGQALGCGAVLAVPGLAMLVQHIASLLDDPWRTPFYVAIVGVFALTGWLFMRERQ